MSDNIKVVVKVRPLISRELEEKLSHEWRVKNNTLYLLDQNGKESGSCFTFDKVYDKDTKTSDIYNDIAKPIVEAATAGFNGTIFAYGQTSSGKTYTMSGTEDSPGIIPLAVSNLFEIIKNVPDRDFLVRVSYIEIYNETLKDLLDVDKKVCKISEGLQGVKVDCVEPVTASPDEVLKYLRQGEANRQTGATNMNETSSRSHSIFQITIESREHIEGEEEVGCVNVSQLNLVDLAGSERAGQTGATGLRFKEGTHINKSLSSLALVIKQLSEDQTKHVNYRDSKLTRILQNSLGGNAKTSIICAVTPAAVEETISTLQFANRAKAIKNKPEVNAVATNATMIQSLTKQLSKLQSQLESKKNLEVMLESRKNVEHNLQKQIAALQRLILNGFGTRSSIDMMSGSRRKLIPPRRVTISTLHPIEESPVPAVPKFHTPLLKYNPMVIPSSADFVPIQNPNKLSSLPEEGENRLITPPPQDKRINYNNEIIELDSDDDSTQDTQACSPYHKCYNSLKTPPCVLRKNAKLAEKNLKDIVELTEREKIYTPSVVELIEKLEQNTTVIARLEDEVITLNKRSKEKDIEIDQLKVKVTKSTEEIKSVSSAKVELEELCKEYTTKLTDWEVSYDTLKKKTKLREDELLSLLEEHNTRKEVLDIGKLPAKPLEKELNFMDMSKDISLVNSDNESSMTNVNDETAPLVKDLVIDMQRQLESKDQSMLQLEADILSQKQKIICLENSSHELQKSIDSFKEKVHLLENENSLLKSTVEILNSTIKSQKSNLESANSDIESYNSLIQELQIKLTDKEKMTNLIINENTLDKMIANEEKFIANNENMKNIIHSFKLALESRNKEIESLKLVVENNSILPDNNNIQEQLSAKEKEIAILTEKAKLLQNKINENVNLIDQFVQEKSYMKDLEQKNTKEMAVITNQCEQLEKTNSEKDEQINVLKINIDELLQTITDKDNLEKELSIKHELMVKNVENLNKTILQLQEDIKVKDNLIISLNAQDTQSQEYIYNANSVVDVLFTIISNFNGSNKNQHTNRPIFDNLNDIFNTIKDNLQVLEHVTNEIVLQKDNEIQKYIELNSQLEASNQNLETEISNLKQNVEEFQKAFQNHQLLKEELDTLINKLHGELDCRNSEIALLKTDLTSSQENNDKLSSDILSKDDELLSIRERENLLISKLDQLKQGIEKTSVSYEERINGFESKEKILQNMLYEKDIKIKNMEDSCKELENTLREKVTELDRLQHQFEETNEKENLLNNVLQHVANLIDSINSEFKVDSNINTYDNILTALNIIATHINTKYSEENLKIDEELVKAREIAKKLCEENNQLMKTVSESDMTKKRLMSRIEEIESENKELNEDLSRGNEMLEVLKTELTQKSNEIDTMVIKTQGLKEHFEGLSSLMKDQIKGLHAENDKLSARCSELEIIENLGIRSDDAECTENDVEYINTTNRKSVHDPKQSLENNSPPSLLTICCNKIVDAIQPNEKSASPSNSSLSIDQSKICECDRLLKDLKLVENENKKLSSVLEELKAANHRLISEQEQVRQEVQLLLEPAFELQKRINNHKTNLSTLTATTYAENRSLRSQVKVLQHHHSRFHKVCQRDLPIVKKQLHDLMTMLKSDNSLNDRLNYSFKRYSLPTVLPDSNSTINTLKNESVLDGDILMMDTNLTLTTSADNTLMGLDQTCLELTQGYSNNDVGCQTYELCNVNMEESQVENFSDSHRNMVAKIEALEAENDYLRQKAKEMTISSSIDAQSSPIKTADKDKQPYICEGCSSLKQEQQSLDDRLQLLSQKLSAVERQKQEIEEKYNNLTLEIPSTDALLKRISIFEKELNSRVQEVTKLTNVISIKNQELKQLQEENDSLSTQVMENITETDELNKELDVMKDANLKLTEKCTDLENLLLEAKGKTNSDQCQTSNNAVDSFQSLELHAKLNRSLSDSDTSSRYNKICTLQNELHAGRQDCKELSEEVTVIKNHLDRSNLSIDQNMDLDDSMGESNIYSFTKHFDSVGNQPNKFTAANVTQDRQFDVYALEKVDCINYFVEKTGADKENFDCNVKIIDILKMFYTNFVMKHNNELENFVNKIKCFEETRHQLENHVKELSAEYTTVTKKLAEKELNFEKVSDTLSQIRQNTTQISEVISMSNSDNTHIVMTFKEKFLKIIDNEFGITSVPLFENLIDCLISKHQNDVTGMMNEYTQLKTEMEAMTLELDTVNSNLLEMKTQLSNKENEYNLLKAQKEKIHEINSAVTLEIVKKEQELCQTIMSNCKTLFENNIISPSEIDINLPVCNNINILFDRLIMELTNQLPQKEQLTLEIKKSRSELEENRKVLEILKIENDKLKDVNSMMTVELDNITSLHEDLTKQYESLREANKSVTSLVDEKSEEIQALKKALSEKEAALNNVDNGNETKLVELMNTVSSYKEEIINLRHINKMILEEKETATLELEKSKELLKTNTVELDKMTADILVLREAVKDNVSVVETLKQEAKCMLQENIKLKEQLDEKVRNCSRLEMNIKTHEKTAEIQSKMIIRHQKQKEEDDRVISEKNMRIEQLTQQMLELQKDSETLRSNVIATREELDGIKKAKEALELRLSELEVDVERSNKPRLSMEPATESTRRRRQSIHDSKRFLDNDEFTDHNKAEAVFESRAKPNDLFMDVDEDVVHSNRSTPLRNSRGRDSLSKHDQSEEASRPSSVAETRRRRQSTHDLRRAGVSHTPEPHERPSSKLSESSNRKSTDMDNNGQSEVCQLRERLSACQQELEELKEQYRELDEECETCAQRLRERDEQCSRLNKEKVALQNIITELKDKLQAVNPNRSQQEPKVTLCHAAVNTDEDWANLHSVVVDRMSFDAEVDKNKRLTKTIEDLRMKKLELKITMGKMQKALEKNAARDFSKELEATKLELKACKLELQELQEKYKELDEECETCSAYLKERDEQCRRLKKEKAALEARLQESRRRTDVPTQICDDFLSYQVERDDNFKKHDEEKNKELGRLKKAVEKLSQQKAALESQLLAAAAAPQNPLYVATGSGIVQNQQLTDVMKENQKLKKINTQLIDICKKRGKKPEAVIEDLSNQG